MLHKCVTLIGFAWSNLQKILRDCWKDLDSGDTRQMASSQYEIPDVVLPYWASASISEPPDLCSAVKVVVGSLDAGLNVYFSIESWSSEEGKDKSGAVSVCVCHYFPGSCFSIVGWSAAQLQSYGTHYEGAEGRKCMQNWKGEKKESRRSSRGHGNLPLVSTVNIPFFQEA